MTSATVISEFAISERLFPFLFFIPLSLAFLAYIEGI